MTGRSSLAPASGQTPVGSWMTRWWQKTKAAAFPPGAITFHLGAWTSQRLTVADAREVKRLVECHGFRRLLVVHGNAIEVGGHVVLIAGPSGIGKSTACRRLEARGAARLIEEGLVLIGVTGERWVMVVTGTLAVLRSASRIRHGLLRPFRLTAPTRGVTVPFSGRRCRSAGSPSHTLAFRLAVLRHVGRCVEFQADLRDVAGLAVAVAPVDPFPSLALDPDGSVQAIEDLRSQAPAGFRTTVFSTLGGPHETVDRIVQAILLSG